MNLTRQLQVGVLHGCQIISTHLYDYLNSSFKLIFTIWSIDFLCFLYLTLMQIFLTCTTITECKASTYDTSFLMDIYGSEDAAVYSPERQGGQ